MLGDFISPPEIEERDERADALPAQEEFWRPATCKVQDDMGGEGLWTAEIEVV